MKWLPHVFTIFLATCVVKGNTKDSNQKEGNLNYGCKCGERSITEEEMECQESLDMPEFNRSRIVNGCESGKVPWFAFFRIRPSVETYRCGGVLINKFWVLSAAHCFCPGSKSLPCKRNEKGEQVILYNMTEVIRINIGLTRLPEDESKPDPDKFIFRPAEIILHPTWNSLIKMNNRTWIRKDHDYALVRLDYPVMDEEHRIGLLGLKDFDKTTIMPICLPDPDFKDTEVQATVVGLGLEREHRGQVCKTNDEGPEIFTMCANGWISEEKRQKFLDDPLPRYLSHGGYSKRRNKYICDQYNPPPIEKDKRCRDLNNKMKSLRLRHVNMENFTKEDAEFLLKYKLSKEILLLPMANMTSKLIKENLTHCFSTSPGEHGWCATCNFNASKGEPGYCSDSRSEYVEPNEYPSPKTTSGWGFCDSNCGNNAWGTKVNMAKLTVFSESNCKKFGNVPETQWGSQTVNHKAELCAGHVQSIDLSFVNVTNNGTAEDFGKIDLNKTEEPLQDEFRSVRLKNFGKLWEAEDNKTTYVIGGVDSCKGDSGGPMWTLGNLTNYDGTPINDVAVLIGLVSRGQGCARPNIPGIYSRVKTIWRWIRNYADKPQIYKYKNIGVLQGRNADTVEQERIEEGTEFLVNPYCRKIHIV